MLIELCVAVVSFSDPYAFFTDPDPTLNLNTDPDPDPAFSFFWPKFLIIFYYNPLNWWIGKNSCRY